MNFTSKHHLGMLFCLIIIFSLSSCRWYQKYGISNQFMLGHPDSVPQLIQALDDPSSKIRSHAISFLMGIGDAAQPAIPTLVSMMGNDRNYRVRAMAVRAVAQIGNTDKNQGINETLMKALFDSSASVRRTALDTLGKMQCRDQGFQQALAQMSKNDPHPNIRRAANNLLAGFNGGVYETAPPTNKVFRQKSPHHLKSALSQSPSRTNRHAIAVIIGNRNYKNANKNIPNVDFAHNDANAIRQFITKTLGYREGNIILIKDATQAELISTFGTANNPRGKLHDWIRPKKSDAFVFYSGHGAPGLSTGEGYLLPVNADPAKVELNGYPLKTLYANLETLPTRSTTVVLDACFSGGSAGGILLQNSSSIALKIMETKPKRSKLIVLTASGPSQTASWDKDTGHGLFTRYFLEGIRGRADQGEFGNQDGKITLGELKKFLEEEVTYAARRQYGREQTPKAYGDLNHALLQGN